MCPHSFPSDTQAEKEGKKDIGSREEKAEKHGRRREKSLGKQGRTPQVKPSQGRHLVHVSAVLQLPARRPPGAGRGPKGISHW